LSSSAAGRCPVWALHVRTALAPAVTSTMA
jgi:hypothetical protein